MTSQCYCVIISKIFQHASACSSVSPEEGGVGGETCRIRVFLICMFIETGCLDGMHVSLFLLSNNISLEPTKQSVEWSSNLV